MEKQKKVAATVSLLPPIHDKLDMKKLFAAFLVGQKSAEAPIVPSTSAIEKKLQEVLDDIQSNKRNVHPSKKPHD